MIVTVMGWPGSSSQTSTSSVLISSHQSRARGAASGKWKRTTVWPSEEFREFFKTNYGPTVVAYRGIAEEPDRVAALDADLAALARRFDVGGGAMEWEYLLLTATRTAESPFS